MWPLSSQSGKRGEKLGKASERHGWCLRQDGGMGREGIAGQPKQREQQVKEAKGNLVEWRHVSSSRALKWRKAKEGAGGSDQRWSMSHMFSGLIYYLKFGSYLKDNGRYQRILNQVQTFTLEKSLMTAEGKKWVVGELNTQAQWVFHSSWAARARWAWNTHGH